MDLNKNLEQYIKPAQWAKIVTCVLAAIVVVSLAVGIGLAGAPDNKSAAVQYDPYSSGTQKGEYAYIDVVMVSDWIYDIDNGEVIYYTVMDKHEQWYVVRLTKQQYSEMAEHYAYFYDENAKKPEPYRIYGIVQIPDADVSDAVAYYWDISLSEYSYYFGNTYLNAVTSPSRQGVAAMFIVVFFAFVVFIVFLLIIIGPSIMAKKSIKRLVSLGELDNAANELVDPSNESLNRDKVRFSKNYVFGKATGAAIKYSDITWCYKQSVSNRGIVTTSLIAQTAISKKLTLFSVGGYDNAGFVQRAMEIIAANNPAMRLGYTAENIQAGKTATL